MPTHTFPHHTLELTLQGQMVVTKSLKAELPEALALDRALVEEKGTIEDEMAGWHH